jgi:hypothetical protein
MRRVIQRYVTGLDASGRSRFEPSLTGPAPQKEDGVNEIWGIASLPADLAGEVDLAQLPYEHDPEPGGVKFRFVEVPPHDPALRDSVELVASPTLDFVMVVEGEITLLVDTEQAIMRPGDCAILRGHAHKWFNHSGRPAFIAGGLVDARPGTRTP